MKAGTFRARIFGLLRNNRFILILAIVVGLLFPGGAEYVEPAMVPLLGLIMTLSIVEVSLGVFLEFRRIIIPIAVALLLNYVLLSGTYIGLSSLIIDDPDIHTGFVLVAAVPPAVAVIPFTFQLGGNTRLSLVGDVAAYLAALAITPLICVIFLGSNFIELNRLLILLGELILAPILVSQVIRRTHVMSTVDRWRGPVVNWSFFIIFYTIFGLNRDAFVGEPRILLLSIGIAFASTFVLGELIDRGTRALGMPKADRISYALLGTRKTYALAGAIALVFFGTRAAMPAAVCSAFNILHFVWLTWWAKRMR
jgi:BASS family bile acid:Na+ symporter